MYLFLGRWRMAWVCLAVVMVSYYYAVADRREL